MYKFNAVLLTEKLEVWAWLCYCTKQVCVSNQPEFSFFILYVQFELLKNKSWVFFKPCKKFKLEKVFTFKKDIVPII